MAMASLYIDVDPITRAICQYSSPILPETSLIDPFLVLNHVG
jgi:hypothetical protein